MGGHEEHRIAADVRGWLESPSIGAVTTDCLAVSGWAFAIGSRIVDVWAAGFGGRRPLRCGVRRDDVALVYPNEPGAATAGFGGYLEFEGPLDACAFLEVWAALDDGRSVRLFKRRLATTAAGRDVSPFRFAVRQAIEHPRLVLSGRSWLNAFALVTRARASRVGGTLQPVGLSEALTRATRTALATFLASGSRLVLTVSPAPAVSIVVVVWNRADLTFACLRALAQQNEATTEVIVVDNGSTDETAELLTRVSGATVVRCAENLGFTVSANLGAKAARGEFLLFVNNDAELMPGCVSQLLDAVRRSSSYGAVGGKLVFPDGRLQEAGSIIWSDGSCEAYGRGSDPAAPEYNFERTVDFCSAALLLTRRDVFDGLGGFDERFRPAYYEDADYCARLWEHGHAIGYQPRAVAVHHEYGSARSREASIELQRERRPIFALRHARWLSSQYSRDRGQMAARSHPHGQYSVVVIDDAMPDPRVGAGFPRAAALLDALTDLGCLITIYATGATSQGQAHGRFPAVEVVAGGPAGLHTFLTSRRHHNLVIVSRPHNMRYVKAAIGSDLRDLGAPCVYDAEAIYALRDIGRRRLAGEPMPAKESEALIDGELALARGCAAVVAVSEAERKMFTAADVPNVFVVSHAVQPQPTPNPFERRRTILLVGAFSEESPNEDAVLFFCHDVLPTLRRDEGCNAPVVVGGARIPAHVKARVDATVSWHSDIEDLTPFYDDARVFVASTRYSAGIPLKVIEAAACGVPIVGTPLVARQLDWAPGVELLTAESPAEFARAIASLYADPEMWLRLRAAALTRVARDYSTTGFRSALEKVLRVSSPPSDGVV